MLEWIISKLRWEPDSFDIKEYLECICDLINHEKVRLMENYIQHGDIDCLEHSIYVSYSSYLICKRLGLDYRSAARGGLLHDFFLYDWHLEKPYKGLHGFRHPLIALQNANRFFQLNEREQEIICKHMWPLTITPPKFKEAYIVIIADKYCAFVEIMSKYVNRKSTGFQNILSKI